MNQNLNTFLNLNKEKYFFYHSFSLTCFSPVSTLYQITQFYPKFNNSKIIFNNIKQIPKIFPQQVLLRYGQLHISSFCKQDFSPIVAFGIIGILQGGIYGHSSLFFAKNLNITKTIQFNHYFRGPIFASTRDIISQGIPFIFTQQINNSLFKHNSNAIYYYGTLLTLSTTSTILSHPFHCFQIYCQNNPRSSQLKVANEMIKKYNWKLFYKGIEGRLLLLIVTNICNDVFLKKFW